MICASSSVAYRIKTAFFNTSRDHGIELRVRQTLYNCNCFGRV